MSWYEYKPEPKHYRHTPPDADSKDFFAMLGVFGSGLAVLFFIGLALFLLFVR
jgi:hypothetical protein